MKVPINDQGQNRGINGRPTIAVLIGSLSSAYQDRIMRGAAYVAEKHDYNIIGFCGGVINSPDPLTLARASVFDLIDMNLISGVISPFSSHTRYLDEYETTKFIDRFSSVPIVNISSRLDGYSSIISDYESSFISLFDHFYNEHGYRNIFLMRGPVNHASSEQRTDIFKCLLDKYEMPFDESMLVYADLNKVSAKFEFEKFLINNERPIDAIITLNDNQALGVIEACKNAGVRVPEDLAVVGSMNTLEGLFSSPKLTSVEEPLFELGQAAARELIAQIEGKTPNLEVSIPTSLIIRRSCGCKAPEESDIDDAPYLSTMQPLNINQDPIYEEIHTNLGRIIEKFKRGTSREDIYTLLNLYRQAIYENKINEFIVALRGKLENSIKSEDIMIWLALVTKFQRTTLKYIESNINQGYIVELLTKLISLKDEVEQVTLRFQIFETDYYLNYFRLIVNDLNSSFDLTRIKKYAVDILNLSELNVAVFEPRNGQDISDKNVLAKNVISVSCIPFYGEGVESTHFPAKTLIPQGIASLKDRFSLLVFPLSFRQKSIGFMTADLTEKKGTAYENLRAIISSALKNELLIQDLIEAEKRFSDIAHSTSNWLWETDTNHDFTYCSDSSADIVGYAPKLLIGKNIKHLSFEQNELYLTNMNNQAVLTDLECWCRHLNGNAICLLLSGKPIYVNGVFNGYRGVFEDITAQKLQEDKITTLAYSDVLTGLPNRTLFQKKLEDTISHCESNNNTFALMFLDLDHFKNINDSMGHMAGDLLLVEIANRLKNSIRPCDIIARLGGDEFTIILPDIVNQKDIIEIVERIFRNAQAPVTIYDKPIYCTLSLGISLYPHDGGDAETLLQRGDSAMYLAKSQGRNGFVFYDKVLEKKHTVRNMYEDILREAIAEGGFFLNLQPQVLASTGTVVGFEALIRIYNRQHGVVGPNHFIPLAEELGLIGQLDEWIFEAVCAQYRDWCDQGLDPKRISINLSAMQLSNCAVLDTYIKILQRYDVDPKYIQLEITENALIQNEEMALTILQGFKRYGVSIALDDFGTGYSSLSCISLYPIDVIKIDRSFVVAAVDNAKDKAIIEAIVLIAKTLDLKIIAEGVETLRQYQFIEKLGCHEIQGFYFYKPLPASEAQTLLKPI